MKYKISKNMKFKPLAILSICIIALALMVSHIKAQPVVGRENAGITSDNPIPDLNLTGRIMSSPYQASFAGNYLAVSSSGGELMLLDISDANMPHAVSYSQILSRYIPQSYYSAQIIDIVVKDQFLYMFWYGHTSPGNDTHYGVEIIDISLPTSPQVLTHISLDSFRKVVFHQDQLYLLSNTNLSIYNIIDPLHLQQASVFHFSSYLNDFIVYDDSGGTTVALVLSSEELSALNIEDPTNPFLETTINIPINYCMDNIATHNSGSSTYLYMNTCDSLKVVDLTDRGNPNEVFTHSFGAIYNTLQLIINDEQLFITVDDDTALWDSTLHIFDLSSPEIPVLSGSYNDIVYTWDIVTQDNTAVLIDDTEGIVLIDYNDPTTLTRLSQYYSLTAYSSMAVKDNYLFTVGGDAIQIVDIFNPVSPQSVSTFSVPGSEHLTGILIQKDYALVTGSGGVTILDISSPLSPITLGVADTGQSVSKDIELIGEIGDGGIAYISSVGCHMYGCMPSLVAVDLDDPLLPVVTVVPSSDNQGVSHIAVVGDYLLGTAYHGSVLNDSDLLVWDRTDPMQPQLLTAIPLVGGATGLELTGNYAYISTWQGDIHIFDLSNLATPILVETVVTDNLLDEIMVNGQWLYARYNDDQLKIFDLAMPTQPELVVQEILPHETVHISAINTLLVQDSFLYVLYAGLTVWQHEGDQLGQLLDVWGEPFASVTVDSDNLQYAVSGVRGNYAGIKSITGTHTLSPSPISLTSYPPTRTITIDATTTDQDFYILPHATHVTLTAGISQTVTFTDTRNLTTTLILPDQQLSNNMYLDLIPTVATPPNGHFFMGNAFELRLSESVRGYDNYTFPFAPSIDIEYSQLGLNRFVVDDTLVLMYEEEGMGWINAGTICNNTQTNIDPTNNTYATLLCKTGKYALFGEINQIYFPFIAK